MANVADILRTYGEIIKDEEHETTKGQFIRITTFKYHEELFVLVMKNGEVVTVGEANV